MQISVQHPEKAVIVLYDYAPSILSERLQGFTVEANYDRRQKGLEEINMANYKKLGETEGVEQSEEAAEAAAGVAFSELPADENLFLLKLNRERVLIMVEKIKIGEVEIKDEDQIADFLRKISQEDMNILTKESINKENKENKKIEKKTSQTPTE